MNENIVDVDTELEDVLESVLPDFQDVIKRAFTNAVVQSAKTSTDKQTYSLGDVSFNSQNNQINLSHLQLVKAPSYRLQSLNVDLSCSSLSLRCSLGEVHVKGLFSAINEDLYQILPAVSEGHLQISLDNVCAEVESGLLLHEDTFLPINPGVRFSHDEVALRISWPSPKESNGYEFTTTEKVAAHIDDLPVTAAISRVLMATLRRQLLAHLELVLVRAAGFSELLNCNLLLMEAYSKKMNSLTSDGNRAMDIVLMHVRKTLLQGRNELLQLPQLRANFTQKVGMLSFIGKFETANGWIKDLATVNRTGDVSMRPGDNANSLSVTLRIRDLKLGFDEYHIKLMGVGPVGRVLVAIEDSSVHVALTAGIQDWKTYAEINHLKIDYFDKLDLHVTGLGPLSWLVTRLRGWLAGYLHAHVLPLVEKQLTHEFNQAFQAVNIWHISSGIKS